jgi:response regulator RpfG family c-di-GMP phosphodiesterase
MSEKRSLRILLIEDSDDDAQLLLREVRRIGYEVVYQRVETADQLISAFEGETWDVVICDYSLPHLDAPQSLEIMKSTGLDLPFIIISGTIDEESAVNALKAGAHDFILKGKYARLGPAIEREMREAGIRKDRKHAEELLREKEKLLSEAQRIGHIGSWSYEIMSGGVQFSDEMYRLLDVLPGNFLHTIDSLVELIYSEDRPAAAGWIDQIRVGRPAGELDFRILHSNGELHFIQFNGAIRLENSDNSKRYYGTAQDITERKQAEVQIRQQLARLTALRTIDQAITSSFDMGFTLDIVLSQVITHLQVDAAGILLLDPTGQVLEYRATRGFRSAGMHKARVHLTDSLAGRVVTERRALYVDNMGKRSQNYPTASLPAGEDFVSYYGLPLITKGKVNGVMELFQHTPLLPYAEWTNFLETLAGQAAIAIDNASLFETLQRTNVELEQAYDATIEGWSHALDLRDRETEGHTLRVTEMALKLARLMDMDEDKLTHMRRGGLLHDIGKLGVPDNILLKPGPLTDQEWAVMRMHPQFAYEWLTPIAYLRRAIEIPYCHHEKWDGSGYPRGLRGKAIPLPSRIFAVADVWDALTSDRPYRKAWTPEKALEYIRENSGTHFDPHVVQFFINTLDDPSSL